MGHRLRYPKISLIVFALIGLISTPSYALSEGEARLHSRVEDLIQDRSDFTAYDGPRMVVDTEVVEEIMAEIRQAKDHFEFIPEGAEDAESQDEFLRMVVEYHVRRWFENSPISQSGIAQSYKKTETLLRNGVSYSDKSENDNGVELNATIDPRKGQLHFRMNNDWLITDLYHSVSSKRNELAFIVPELLSGELKVILGLDKESEAHLYYEVSW